MRQVPRLAALILLTGCYLTPDTHRVSEDVRAPDAGSADVEVVTLPDATPLDASMEPDVGSAPAQEQDASVIDAEPLEVDAGCASSSACPGDAPLCRAGACVACQSDLDCSRFGDAPACGAQGACVACTPSMKSLCRAPTPACDPATSRCVECSADADCMSEQKAACGVDQKCGTCKDDTDCARFSKVCESKTGACVQCRPESEATDCRSDRTCDPEAMDCPGTACDPKRLMCTSRQRGSVALCQPCVSDSECLADHRCIPMNYGGGGMRKELGGFCMKLAMTQCTEPYRATAITRESLSGATATAYCGIDEAVTSCAAIQALREDRDCTDAASCQAPGARCESVSFGATKTCTYACSSNRDCPGDVPCGGPAGATYCGGPP